MAAAEAFVAAMGNFTMVAMVTVGMVTVTVAVVTVSMVTVVVATDSLAFVETDDRGLAMASWNSFVALESDTSVCSAAG